MKPGITGMWQVSGRSDIILSRLSSLIRSIFYNWNIGRILKGQTVAVHKGVIILLLGQNPRTIR